MKRKLEYIVQNITLILQNHPLTLGNWRMEFAEQRKKKHAKYIDYLTCLK